ncbi:MAG TPA: antibiotic biosynthesis monooxygenase [Firmicutes bacterium]|nr:antibiotic biosynthesis monooxygenase [Bacillota bacterium]
MFIEMKRFTVKRGNAEKIIEKFSGKGKAATMEGFIDFSIMKRLRKDETEEVLIQIRWEDQESFTKWKRSDAHKAGHANRPKERPDFIVDVSVDMYEVETIKTAVTK